MQTVILAAVLAAALAAVYGIGVLIPAEDMAGSFLNAGRPPDISHPFGTDALGNDLLFRTLKGLSASMTIGLAASAISAVIAVFAGVLAAAGPKGANAVMDWLIDLVMSVPHMVLIILISFVLGCGQRGLLAGIAATHWCSLARLVRGEVLQLMAKQYVAISRKLGKSGGWIFFHHLLPHLAPQLLVGLVILFPHAILHEASVSFLGFGLPPEQPAIGMILAESMRYLSAGMWWPAVLPGLTLVLVVLLASWLAEKLRMLFDPGSVLE